MTDEKLPPMMATDDPVDDEDDDIFSSTIDVSDHDFSRGVSKRKENGFKQNFCALIGY